MVSFVQALLVRERILGPAHPDTSYYIRYRGAVYADMGHFERCITLWMYALDMQQKILEPLSPMTQSSLLSFAELFSFMMSEGGRSRGQVPFANLGGGARAAADLPINENMNQTSPPSTSQLWRHHDGKDVSLLYSCHQLSAPPGVQARSPGGEGRPECPGGRGGKGRRLHLLQPDNCHPSSPSLSTHQAHSTP